MSNIDLLFTRNKAWIHSQTSRQPDFFSVTAKEQKPEYLWIGCCDSRVSPELVTGSKPGEMLVHRNIANQLIPSDANGYAILEFALSALKIRKIIVAGHTGCGGIGAALKGNTTGATDTWLTELKKLCHDNEDLLNQMKNETDKVNLLSELNVRKQVNTIALTPIAQQIWAKQEVLSIYGVIYDITTGELKNLHCDVNSLPSVQNNQ